jgi:hypothetical protein
MKPLLRYFRLSPRSMPGGHGNDNDALRLKRIAEIRRLIAEIAVEPPSQECCADQDNDGALRACGPVFTRVSARTPGLNRGR